MECKRINGDKHRSCDAKVHRVSHNVEHDLFLVGHRVCFFDEVCRFAKKSVRSRTHYKANRLAAARH